MPIAKSRLVGVIEIPEIPARQETATIERDDLTLKQTFRRLAATPQRSSGRSRLEAEPASPTTTIIYADLGQLCAELKAEAARLEGHFRG